jgi:hypothetical protein
MLGSIDGSGIGQVQMEREFTCGECLWIGEALGSSDDLVEMLFAVCPNCKEEMTIDLAQERESEHWDDKPDFD